MDWFWHALLVCFVIITATVLWLAIIVELIRRHDLSTWGRIGWLLVILIFPVIGSLPTCSLPGYARTRPPTWPQPLRPPALRSTQRRSRT